MTNQTTAPGPVWSMGTGLGDYPSHLIPSLLLHAPMRPFQIFPTKGAAGPNCDLIHLSNRKISASGFGRPR
jgi:hypothetical protein